ECSCHCQDGSRRADKQVKAKRVLTDELAGIERSKRSETPRINRRQRSRRAQEGKRVMKERNLAVALKKQLQLIHHHGRRQTRPKNARENDGWPDALPFAPLKTAIAQREGERKQQQIGMRLHAAGAENTSDQKSRGKPSPTTALPQPGVPGDPHLREIE